MLSEVEFMLSEVEASSEIRYSFIFWIMIQQI